MVKRLSFLLILNLLIINSINAADSDEPLSPEGMGVRRNAFCRHPSLADRFLADSASELDRSESELLLGEYSDPEDDPISYLASLFDIGLIDQEALVREKVIITAAFQTVLASSAFEIRSLLPDSTNLESDFAQCSAQLENWYSYVLNGKFSDKRKFMASNAMQTLLLLGGDTAVSRHPISSVESYSNFSYLSLPNAKQLFVFACKLSDVTEPQKFVRSYLAENFADPLKWQMWKKPFAIHFPSVLSHDELGLALAADKASGSRFVNGIVDFLRFGETLPCPTNSIGLRQMSTLLKAYNHSALESITPITESLYMARRGHNVALFDVSEVNRPACAEGLYLNLIRETSAMLSGVFMFDSVALDSCV